MYVKFLETNADVDILNKTYTLQEANKIISSLNPSYQKKRRKNEVVFQIINEDAPVYKGIIQLGSSNDLIQHIESTLETVKSINQFEKEKFISLLHSHLQEKEIEPILPDLADEGWEEFNSELQKLLGNESKLFTDKQKAELYNIFLIHEKEKGESIQPFQMASIIFAVLKEQIINPVNGEKEFEHYKTYIKMQLLSIPYHEYWQTYSQNVLYQAYCDYINKTKSIAMLKIHMADLKYKLFEEQLLHGQAITKDNAQTLIDTVVASLIEKEILSDNTGEAEKRLAHLLPESYQRGDILSKKELTNWYKESGADVAIMDLIHGNKEIYRTEVEKEVIHEILQRGFDDTDEINCKIIQFFNEHTKKLLKYLKDTFNPKEVKEQMYQSYIQENDEEGKTFKLWGATHYINQNIGMLKDYFEE